LSSPILGRFWVPVKSVLDALNCLKLTANMYLLLRSEIHGDLSLPPICLHDMLLGSPGTTYFVPSIPLHGDKYPCILDLISE